MVRVVDSPDRRAASLYPELHIVGRSRGSAIENGGVPDCSAILWIVPDGC
jgi:hypothetical protein